MKQPVYCDYKGDDTIGYRADTAYTTGEPSWEPKVAPELADENKQYRGLYSSRSCHALRSAEAKDMTEGQLRRLLPPHRFSTAAKCDAWGPPTDTANIRGESLNSHQPMVCGVRFSCTAFVDCAPNAWRVLFSCGVSCELSANVHDLLAPCPLGAASAQHCRFDARSLCDVLQEALTRIAPLTSGSTWGTQPRMNIVDFTRLSGAGPNIVDTPG